MNDINIHLEDDKYRVHLFNNDNPEFERVRQLCLQDTENKLRANYLAENLVIEDHDIFGIMYSKQTGNPLVFAGVYNNGRYPEQVARVLNRLYLFPELREIPPGVKLPDIIRMVQRPMVLHNPRPRLLNFVSMQMRSLNYRGQQRWWRYWSENMIRFNEPETWRDPACLIQVAKGEANDSYQNIIYTDSENYRFSDWNPKTRPYSE